MTAVPCRRCPLRALPAIRPLDASQIEFIQSLKGAHRALPAGAAIVPEGGATGELFTLFSGFAFRYASLSDGRVQILNFLLPGDFIGLQERLGGQAPYGVEALTPVELCAFPQAALWRVYREHPELGYDLTWLAAHGERLVDGNLVSVGRRSATERVAMLLVHLHKRLAALGLADERGAVPFPLTQQHIADALGLSLVHTNRTLRRLRGLGLCEVSGGRLALLEPRALQRVADYWEQPLAPRPLL